MGLSVGERIIATLRANGVDTVFGIPGAHTIELYKHLNSYGIRHITARHEQGAGYMADGYARASGRPGVCLLVAGPGLTNAASALGTAYADSSPVLVLTSVNAVTDLDMERGHLHEVSFQSNISRSVSALSLLALNGEQAEAHLRRAFFMFGSSRPRPVHISLPLDVLESVGGAIDAPPTLPYRPGPHPEALQNAAKILKLAKRPMFVVGGGAVGAAAAVKRLAERLGATVVTTIAGKGIMSDSHPLSLGASLQRAPVRMALRRADVLVAVGTQLSPVDLELWPHSLEELRSMLDENEALEPERLGHCGKLIRIDLDPGAMTRDHLADVALLCDCELALKSLLRLVPSATPANVTVAMLHAKQLRSAVSNGASDRERRHRVVLDALNDSLPRDAFVAADLCQLGYSANVFCYARSPSRWYYPAGFGPLGFAMPAGIGAQLSDSQRRGIVLIGDYGVQFTIQELGTAAELKLPLPIIIWNNGGLGEIKDWMRMKNAPEIAVEPINPDFKKIAEAYVCGYERPESEKEFKRAIRAAHRAKSPTVIELCENMDWLR